MPEGKNYDIERCHSKSWLKTSICKITERKCKERSKRELRRREKTKAGGRKKGGTTEKRTGEH